MGAGAGAAGAGLSGAAGAAAAPAAASSGGFLSGVAGASGLMTDGKFDTTKAGGLVGSLLGQAATQPGQTPGAPDVRMADFPQAVQQAMGQKPWATGQYDSYLKQLMGGG